MKHPAPPVDAVFQAIPKAPRLKLLNLRELIFEAALASETGPLEESLKWGQPAYRPLASRTGTTIRLGWTDAIPERISMYVPCQTTLVDSYRERFPDAAQYDGNRAIHFNGGTTIDKNVLHQIATMALTYHRAKRAQSAPAR